MESAEAVERVAEGLDMLAGCELDALSDVALDEGLTGLLHEFHRMEAQLARLAERWQRRGVWSGDGSKSPASRLSREGRCGKATSQTILRRGRQLVDAPTVAEAFACGDLSGDQVDVLMHARYGREQPFARDEAFLVDQGRLLRFIPWCKVMAYWRRRADAVLGRDGTAPDCGSGLSLTPVGDMVAVDGQLDAVGGAIVVNALDAIMRDLATDDRACGRPERKQRELRAAALVEMARRAMAMPADAKRARVLLNIVCGDLSFTDLCELSSGVVIQPREIIPYLGVIDVRTIVFDTPMHAIAASSRRTFTGAVRAAVQVRDRHCQHPSGCDEPIDRCDVDHIVPWSLTQRTDQDNGRLLCTFHNRIEPQRARPSTTLEDLGWNVVRTTYDELMGRAS